jgi:hypothetical protein
MEENSLALLATLFLELSSKLIPERRIERE